jgi:hypothetical protein
VNGPPFGEGGGMGPRSTFPKARRRKAYRRIVDTIKQEDTGELLPLDEVTRRLRQFEQTYVGIQAIPVDRIVGTLDRTADYDREFLPRRRGMGERWRRVEQVGPASFPPIVVYELDGQYFVVDGHHRVAIAKQLGMDYIDAEVTRLRTRFPLPEGADIARIIFREQEGLFMEESGLARARPEAHIEVSRPHGYVELLEQVKVHGYHLMMERGEVLPPEEIAADWYDWVYLPVVVAMHNAGLFELYPRALEGDLFLWVQQRRRELFTELGPRSLEDDIRALRDAEISHRQHRARRALERIRHPRSAQ